MTPERFFRALSDQTRLRCLVLMQRAGELCVCELTEALDMVQPKISRHLASLREAGVVADRRDGLWVFYRLHDDLPGWAREILAVSAGSLHAQAPFAEDAARLQPMTTRPRNGCAA
ncbi:metalloregulator ArsR/SmtB family transcription factor [Acidihalobacter prosperus]|uniref:Transcriptional regulator n=1 Tax=Acidihalobacter prosperus TaxID=160660 RepID=A0A1A6C409_9GAMM|nr:metalloregulator ArsR/SmtB family transcription factor [Acidihalobacter prosperus]OBS09302.1 transcriptional regulator [Acidihalobacter prosperus]